MLFCDSIHEGVDGTYVSWGQFLFPSRPEEHSWTCVGAACWFLAENAVSFSFVYNSEQFD